MTLEELRNGREIRRISIEVPHNGSVNVPSLGSLLDHRFNKGVSPDRAFLLQWPPGKP